VVARWRVSWCQGRKKKKKPETQQKQNAGRTAQLSIPNPHLRRGVQECPRQPSHPSSSLYSPCSLPATVRGQAAVTCNGLECVGWGADLLFGGLGSAGMSKTARPPLLLPLSSLLPPQLWCTLECEGWGAHLMIGGLAVQERRQENQAPPPFLPSVPSQLSADRQRDSPSDGLGCPPGLGAELPVRGLSMH